MSDMVDPKAIQRLADDTSPAMMQELFVMFSSDLRSKREALLQAANASDLVETEHVAHAMAGVAATFGATMLEKFLRMVMETCHTGNADKVSEMASEIPFHVQRSEDEIQKLIQQF